MVPNGYAAIAAEAQRAGLPRTFATDLTVHDAAWIRSNPGKAFVWALREHGTHLCAVTADPIDGAGTRAWTYPRIVSEAFAPSAVRFYVWDGVRLTEYHGHEACGAAVRELATRRESATVAA